MALFAEMVVGSSEPTIDPEVLGAQDVEEVEVEEVEEGPDDFQPNLLKGKNVSF